MEEACAKLVGNLQGFHGDWNYSLLPNDRYIVQFIDAQALVQRHALSTFWRQNLLNIQTMPAPPSAIPGAWLSRNISICFFQSCSFGSTGIAIRAITSFQL
jgi:hypothetical protein